MPARVSVQKRSVGNVCEGGGHYLKLLFAGLLCSLSACVNYQYQAQPLEPDSFYNEQINTTTDSRGFREFLQGKGINSSSPITGWDLEMLLLAQLYFNPDINVAINTITIEQANRIIAEQRINPQLNLPLEHHSDTSDGRSPWLIGLFLDFVYEREGKREARISRAMTGARLARINVEQTAWSLQQQLQAAYIDYFVAIEIRKKLDEELKILERIIDVLERRKEAGEASQFEISVNRLEYQKVLLDITKQETQVSEHYHRLVGLIGINAEKFDAGNIEFNPSVFNPESMPVDRPDLNSIALKNRFDIRKALTEYELYEAELRLEIEKQYPDITLSPGFVFDQDDKIWALGTAWLLPVLHNNDGQIEKALAQRRLMQDRFRRLQSGIINSLNSVWARYESARNAWQQSLQLLEDARQNTSNIRRQYEIGFVDQLEVLRSDLETKRLESAVFELKLGVIRSLVALENQLQQEIRSDHDYRKIILDLIEQRLESEQDEA